MVHSRPAFWIDLDKFDQAAAIFSSSELVAAAACLKDGGVRRTFYNWPKVARLLSKRKDLFLT